MKEERSMSTPSIKLTFPKVEKIVLSSFSLYSLQPVITVDFPDGVFCLAGANGLGKSTFLSAINYAITGIVSDPQRKFESVDEYYRYSLKFSADYFSGRINETDRDAAEVDAEIRVGKHLYHVTRGMFEPSELRGLTVYDTSSDSSGVVIDGSDMTPTERHEEYAKQIASDVGVGSFEQLVFLQHFVLTFDERRLLLFFEKKILEQALYLSFGVDHVAAKRADALRRESEKADSLVRNFQWRATDVRNKIKDIEEKSATSSKVTDATNDLASEHQKLIDEAEAEQAEVDRIENEIRDATLRLAEASSEQVALRAEYAEEFARRIQKNSHVTHHPLIISSITEHVCGLCGAQGEQVASTINLRVSATNCPLCDSGLSKDSSKSKSIARLQGIDEKLVRVQIKLDEAVKTLDRLKPTLATSRAKLNGLKAGLDKFERSNERALMHLKASSKGSGGVSSLLDTYRAQMEEYLSKKEENKQKRDEKRAALRKIQRGLEKQYSAAEINFVPLFKDLAYRFLGLDLDIRMETNSSPSINLALEVKGTVRRQNHQLSESQRFFVDIALRMAMAQFMSSPDGKACLFVDTPEGSLDIAYENRAGDMLAKFVNNDHHIIMTANINSSRLIRSLAERCGRARMTLCRMTEWSELSDVQIAEEKLFSEAYKAIEKSLDSHKVSRK
jgi:energy-coupling factor transporter ATP-binding protein EcfA2